MLRFLIALIIFMTGLACLAQKPELRTRTIDTGRDSLVVEYVAPDQPGTHPAVLLLTDRFGIQKGTRQLAVSLAEKGFRVYLLQMASTPVQEVSGFPKVELYSSDYDLIGQVAVEAKSSDDGNGKCGLLAFDAGAALGAEMARRIPLFQAVALVYPSQPESLASILSTFTFPYVFIVGKADPEYTLGRINEIRESCMERGGRLPLVQPQGATRFFFNPEHENYHKAATVVAWASILRLFSASLH